MRTKPPDRLRVGLVFDDSLDSDDGVAQYVKTLGSWLSRQGHEVRYLVGETKARQWAGGRVYSLARNQKVYFNGNWLSMPLPASTGRIKEVLENERFDVLHVMVPYSPFMAQKLIRLAPDTTAIIGTFHVFPAGRWTKNSARLLRQLYGSSLRRFSVMLSVSQPAADFANSVFGLKSVIIPNPIMADNFTTSKSKPGESSTRRIIFLGRLVKRKGARQLVEAFSRLVRELPDCRLVIAGDGAERARLEKLARRLGLGGNVEFLGYISEDEKPGLLASADVACFPSLYGESFGIVLLEAMAAGSKTVLGGDNPGYRSVLGGRAELLVDPNDTAAFAARLKQLLTDEKLRDEILRWQKSEVRKYDISLIGPKIINTYESAIARLTKTSHNKAHG